MQRDFPTALTKGPLLLNADNVTSLTRTPWAGERLGRQYKGKIDGLAGRRIGEAWEFSCDPAFPSRFELFPDLSLLEATRRWPAEIFGKTAVAAGLARCELLVKILDTGAPLSLQVHPADGDPSLTAFECGKPESWLVLDADAGAGLWLGFSKSMTRSELQRLLLESAKPGDFLQFVPVRRGDYFEIGPGVPHAIGTGVTLLEPQRVIPGLSGKTYRLWDWGRRYKSDGSLDSVEGEPRELHVEAGLRWVDPSAQVGPAYANALRRVSEVKIGPRWQASFFPANNWYAVTTFDLDPAACARVRVEGGFGALIVLKGAVSVGKDCAAMCGGQSALIAAVSPELVFEATAATQLAIVVPFYCRLRVTHD